MKLPDFSKWLEFIELRESMGVTIIPELPHVEFTKTVKRERVIELADTRDKQTSESLRGSVLEATHDDLTADPISNQLIFRGRKVVAYIRDQRQGIHSYKKTSDYRYHLLNCATLHRMRSEGRETRYFVTRRRDGWFLVKDLSGFRIKERTLRLKLCWHCIQELREKRLYFEPFSLEEYFRKYGSYVPKTITKTEHYDEVQTYQPNQQQLSDEYRRAVNYTCQRCGVEVGMGLKRLLHLHHRDGNTANNDRDNLSVLCILCHSGEPYHSHLGNTSQQKQDIALVRKAQLQQGNRRAF